MTIWPIAGGLALLVGLLAAHAGAVEPPQLYESAPKGGVAYIRFVNTTAGALAIASGPVRIELAGAGADRITRFERVSPGKDLSAVIERGAQKTAIKLSLAPNELVTVALTAEQKTGAAAAVGTVLFRETPSDFNALKASLALYNADPGCAQGQLVAGEKNTSVISGVATGASDRRMVNPVSATLAARCAGAGDPVPAALGALEAGERYSIFILPADKSGHGVLAVRDETAPARR
jgi:hypothetical protein